MFEKYRRIATFFRGHHYQRADQVVGTDIPLKHARLYIANAGILTSFLYMMFGRNELRLHFFEALELIVPFALYRYTVHMEQKAI